MLHVSSLPNCSTLPACCARPERPSNRCAGDDREEIAPPVHANCLWSRQSLAKGSVVCHSKIGPRTPLWVKSGGDDQDLAASHVHFAPKSAFNALLFGRA